MLPTKHEEAPMVPGPWLRKAPLSSTQRAQSQRPALGRDLQCRSRLPTPPFLFKSFTKLWERHRLTRLCMFQGYDSVIPHLCIAQCVTPTVKSLSATKYLTPLPFAASLHPRFPSAHHRTVVCVCGDFGLSVCLACSSVASVSYPTGE